MENNDWIRLDRFSPLFPPLLKKADDHPGQYWYARGNVRACAKAGIAIVGTRRASLEGIAMAKKLAGEATHSGLSVISGLALGIDTAAHAGCIQEHGTTIAVLASGIDQIYPRSNASLAKQILSNGGCLISQYPPKTPSYPNQFIARNKVIAALARAVVVIEAPQSSGSLATARFAKELKRPIGVVPGPANAPLYQGSINLIRDGAFCIRSIKDLLSDVPSLQRMATTPTADHHEKKSPSFEKTTQHIYDVFSTQPTPLSVDKLVSITTLDPQTISSALTELIIENAIDDLGNGRYQRKQ